MWEFAIKILGEIFSVFVRWWEKPSLKCIGFDNADNITWVNPQSGQSLTNEVSYWIRLKIKNEGRSIAQKCTVRLISVNPVLGYFNPLQLLWVRSGESQQQRSIDISPKDERIFDVGFVTRSDNRFHIHPADTNSAINSVIEYPKNVDRTFELRIFSDNHKTITISFTLKGTSAYNNFRFDNFSAT